MDTSMKQQLLFRLWGAFLMINIAFVTSLHFSGVPLQTAALIIVSFALVSCVVLWFLFRTFEDSQQAQDNIFTQMERLLCGELLDLNGIEGKFGDVLKALEDEFEQVRSGDKESKANTLRLTQALQGCQANVMIANNDLEIVYVNKSVENMFHRNKDALQQLLPKLEPSKLVGTCVDLFHKSPQHQRSMVENLSEPYKTRLPLNELTFDLIATPLFDDDNERIGTVVEWYDITDDLHRQELEAQISRDNLRIKNALDVCQANVMMADNEYNIVYVNESLDVMLSSNEDTLQGVLPRFDMKTLIGTNVDVFHKNPQHQRNMISSLTETYETQLTIDSLIFNLIATPVFDDENIRIGTVVEWKDMTESLRNQELEAKVSRDNLRIKNALDVCQANVMMADNEYNIVYANESLNVMLTSNEKQLRSALPRFDMQTLIGTNVDVFHKNPQHQRKMISELTETYETQLTISNLIFNLIATPVFDDDRNRIGTVVEWKDMTETLHRQELQAQISRDNLRIKNALDVCQANVMMADNEYNIVYVNESLVEMMSSNEQTLRKALSRFDVKSLVGTNVDVFHKNPKHQREMISNLTETYQTRLTISGLKFDLIATPVFVSEGERIGTVVEWKDVTQDLIRIEEEQKVAQENARIRQALDNVNTNTMIANADNDIIYMNKAIGVMLARAEADIKTALPNFDSRNLLGQNIDQFHKNPAHQQNLLSSITTTYQAQISVGGRSFSLVTNPIVSDKGDRIGTVVEWNDRTIEVRMENEIDDLIAAAARGDLSKRIQEDGKDGFFKALAGGLNRLVSIADGVIEETASMLDAMAHGNLTQRINSDYEGSFNKLKSDANATAEKLTEVIANISGSASTVTSGSEEIAQGNADLSQRTEEQASSLEETASSMEQMTSTVKQNADNSRVASELASDASKRARNGGEVVRKAVESMSEINQSSKKISDIIGVIDEIAFQTNLLALNAAVEAARAGEQGRGFAVVAGEVRNLAQRSAAAAKEIKDLIRDSVTKVEDGTVLVNESGEMLSEIVGAIEKVSQMIQDISVASSEQSEGIEQVNKAISQMDEMTQQNAALVEEASAAGESMADQARSMKQMLSFFAVQAGQVSNPSSSNGYHAKPSAPAYIERKPQSAAQNTAPAPSNSGKSFDFGDEDWQEF